MESKWNPIGKVGECKDLNRLWACQFLVREEEGVVGDVSLWQVCMETREGVWVVG